MKAWRIGWYVGVAIAVTGAVMYSQELPFGSLVVIFGLIVVILVQSRMINELERQLRDENEEP